MKLVEQGRRDIAAKSRDQLGRKLGNVAKGMRLGYTLIRPPAANPVRFLRDQDGHAVGDPMQ
eukprot:13716553-Alexandrium_andersonii.AAC.1